MFYEIISHFCVNYARLAIKPPYTDREGTEPTVRIVDMSVL